MRIKRDITSANIEECNNIIENIPLREFSWDRELAYNIQDPGRVIGVIAQECEQIVPQCVKTIGTQYGIEDFKAVDTNKIMWTMLGAIQYLQKENSELKRKVDNLISHK